MTERPVWRHCVNQRVRLFLAVAGLLTVVTIGGAGSGCAGGDSDCAQKCLENTSRTAGSIETEATLSTQRAWPREGCLQRCGY